ncbi:MAG: L,D-transpeptidase family protein, partial [Phycisphaerae bacterium]
TAMINEALALLNERPARVIEARDRLNELLPLEMTPQQRMLVKQQLSALADVWLFSPTVYPKDTLCEIYQVKSGDLLKEIGRVNNVPWEIIQELNKISRPEALQVGQTLKIVKGPFHARVFRSKFIMDLYLQDTYVKSFAVGLGKPEHETPTGTWVVKPGGKLIKPTWTDPDTGKTYQADDPDYPLGSRWIALDGISGNAVGRTGFAIHGTQKPEEIGSATSRGCIRLHNGDVLLMYNLMMPGASRVEIVD